MHALHTLNSAIISLPAKPEGGRSSAARHLSPFPRFGLSAFRRFNQRFALIEKTRQIARAFDVL